LFTHSWSNTICVNLRKSAPPEEPIGVAEANFSGVTVAVGFFSHLPKYLKEMELNYF
jgi:hypothetical protein